MDDSSCGFHGVVTHIRRFSSAFQYSEGRNVFELIEFNAHHLLRSIQYSFQKSFLIIFRIVALQKFMISFYDVCLQNKTKQFLLTTNLDKGNGNNEPIHTHMPTIACR